MAARPEEHTVYVNNLRGQNADIFSVKLRVRVACSNKSALQF
jgi:hypothetical protein